jgi:hypothetical protein
MADTVTSTVLFKDVNRYVIRLTNLCDGTGESAVQKVDKSGMVIGGQYPGESVTRMAIDRIQGSVTGFTNVQLWWDHTANDLAAALGPGTVDLDFREFGGVHDPQSAGGTGDLLVTTTGNTAGDIYDLTVEMRFY